MFRQIGVDQADRNLQRIMLSSSPNSEAEDFNLNTVTYGTTCDPYLAFRTLKQLALDERLQFPLGAECLDSNMYVDDTFAGDDPLSDRIRRRDQLVGILKTAEIDLDNWAVNHPDLLPAHARLSEEAPLKEIDRESSVKTLALQGRVLRPHG